MIKMIENYLYIKRYATLFILIFFVSISSSVFADVFTLWPFSSGNDNQSGNLSDALRRIEIMSEPVDINGKRLSLKVALLEQELRECLLVLKKLYPEARFALGDSAITAMIQLPDGHKKKIYLLQVGGEYPVIEFSMDLPEKMPKPLSWPQQLPLPPGAEPKTYIYFPERDSYYGFFSTITPPEQTISDIKLDLTGKGWSPISKAETNSFTAVLVKESPPSILTLSVSESTSGVLGSNGSVYMRPLNK